MSRRGMGGWRLMRKDEVSVRTLGRMNGDETFFLNPHACQFDLSPFSSAAIRPTCLALFALEFFFFDFDLSLMSV